MSEFYVKIGEQASFTKTVGETDVYLFAGITGDFARNHVDKPYMENSAFGQLQAHGALLVGFMSTVAGLVAGRTPEDSRATPVSLGYDRVRFLAPVFFGDTVTVKYRIAEVDLERKRSKAHVEAVNQQGKLVAVATHIMAWVNAKDVATQLES